MKTFVASAFILSLTASAFAADPQCEQTPEPRKAQALVVLTATQLDGVTAGSGTYLNVHTNGGPTGSASSDGFVDFQDFRYWKTSY